MQLLQWLTNGAKILRRCSVCCGCHFDGCGELFSAERKINDDLRFLNYTGNCSQLSTSSTMSQNFRPIFVYQRRRERKNSVSFFQNELSDGAKPSDACHSAICSEAPPLATEEHVVSVPECATEGVRSPLVQPVENIKLATPSTNGFRAVEEAGSEEALTTDVDRILNDCSANDHCSSSKSNLEHKIKPLERSEKSGYYSSAALKVHTDDAGECSSSGALIAGKPPAEISERDVCISILRSQGLLDNVWIRRERASNESSSNNYCSKSCKVCEQTDNTRNMLICDNCDDAFHTSCYTPRITMLPVSEWLCSSCLKKKHKILNDKSTSSNLANTSPGSGRNRPLASELELGSLEFMLRDTEPYMSNVRIGDEFQADVPDWCGPINEECDLIADLLETDTSRNSNMQDQDAIKSLKRNPIGNWLQCREVIEGVGEGIDGTVCAKWRRAPLFEVQTDNWECFRCILWDPTHADCAVPQELETEEVMRQLKYMETLRPRLAAKRRKLASLKGSSSQNQPRL